MKFSKKEGQKAFELLQQWRSEGVPDLITSFEAFKLTKGQVGFPYQHKNKNKPCKLIEVAVQAIKKEAK